MSDDAPASNDWATRTLRVGVAGLGFTGATHLKWYQQQPNVELVALAGLEEDRLAQLGAEFRIPHRYHDYREMLARDDLDLISVCTPNYLHAPVAIAALEGGRHVLCEKPLARTGAEAAAMVAAARQANRVLHTAFNHRARGDVATLKAHIEGGGLGRVYHAKASWMRRSGIPALGSWFTNKEMAGGGPLIDLGVHMLDMALYLLDEPQPVTVSAATYAEIGPQGRGAYAAWQTQGGAKQTVGSAYEVEDLATAFIRFADGGTLLLEASWAVYGSAGDDFGVTLFGTQGGAEIKVLNYGWQDTLRLFTDIAGTTAEVQPRVGPIEGHAKVVRDFVATVRSGVWSGHHGEVGLRRAQIIEACYNSARAGREVVLGD